MIKMNREGRAKGSEPWNEESKKLMEKDRSI